MKGPSAVFAYLKSLLARRPMHFMGHNPAGAVAIVALLALTVAVVATGYVTYADFGGEWLEDVHEAAAEAMLAIVVAHVAGVLAGSILHRENLVRSMISGRKAGSPSDAIASSRWGAALVLVAIVASVWWFQSRDGVFKLSEAPSQRSESARATASSSGG